MAISIIQQPQDLTPAYNQNIWVFDSTNKNFKGFRYNINIYESVTNTHIANLKVAPEPNTGYGYVDISKILSTQVSYDYDTTGSYKINAPNSFFQYYIAVNEEYLYFWDFTSITWTPGDGYYTLNGTTDAIWNLNNSVEIEIATGDTWSQGLHIVLTSPPNVVTIIGEYEGSGTATGTVYWANRTKTEPAPTNTSDVYIFNGRKLTYDYIYWTASDYIIPDSGASTTRKLLTNLPDNFYCTPDQDLYVDIFTDPAIVNTLRVRVENSNGDIFRTVVWNNAPDDDRITQFSIGPNNFFAETVVSGTLPLIKSDTEWYEFKIVNAANTTLTKTYRIYIDNRCKIEDYEILFMDRMGSFMSYAFQLRSKETGNIDRKSYNKFLGTVETLAGWVQTPDDAGETIYNVDFNKELELNTNWMTDEMSIYFEELLTSPITFLKVDGYFGTPVYLPIIIIDNSFEIVRQKNKNLIKKTIRIRFANKEIVNI